MSRRPPDRRAGYRGKRALDLVVAVPALLVLAPLLGVIAVLVLVTLGRPVLFRQDRPGLDEAVFRLIKFRSLLVEAHPGEPDQARMTRLGRLLVRSSLDELPSLWNVVRGEMSLVGPRPLLVEYLPLYDEAQKRRHCVRPGLTGWAQVHGRNDVDWGRRLALDAWYAEQCSLRLDLRILARTVAVVLTGVGVTAPGSVTMPRFQGSHGECLEPSPPSETLSG